MIKQGSFAVPSVVTIDLSLADPKCPVFTDNQQVSALWFLQQSTKANGFILMDYPRYPRCHPTASGYDIPAGSLSPQWRYPADISVAGKLGYELAASIEAHNGVGPYALVLNANLLQGMSDADLEKIYDRFAASDQPALSSLGSIGLLRLGDAATLSALTTSREPIANRARPTKVYEGNGTMSDAIYPEGQTTYQRHVASSISEITNQSRPPFNN